MPRRSMERDDPAAGRIAELEDENAALLERLADAEEKAEELGQRLEQREGEMEELIDARDEALREPADYAEPACQEPQIVYVDAPPPRAAVSALWLWSLVTARLALDAWGLWKRIPGFGRLYIDVCFIVFCTVFVGNWDEAEERANGAAGFVKGVLFVLTAVAAAYIYSGGAVTGGRMPAKYPELTLIFVTLAFAFILSPVVNWIVGVFTHDAG